MSREGWGDLPSVNWIGVWTLYRREVRRFLKVAAQTVAGPAVTTTLILLVFSVALGRRTPAVEQMSYTGFLAPGLIMMSVMQNAFANTSSSLLIAKLQGNIADFLMAPLSPAELTWGFALSGVTRGVLVGVVVGLAMWPFVPLDVVHPAFVLLHALAASLLLALLGILGGLWAQKMDQLAAVTSFVVTPLTFLSGTFYSVGDLPGPFQTLARLNPFFYMIDGFRYGMTDQADGSLAVGLLVVTGANLALVFACHRLFAAGWRLKP